MSLSPQDFHCFLPSAASPVQSDSDSGLTDSVSSKVQHASIFLALCYNPHPARYFTPDELQKGCNRVTRKTSAHKIVKHPVNAIIKYPETGENDGECVSHVFNVHPHSFESIYHPKASFQYSLGNGHGGCDGVECLMLKDSQGWPVQCNVLQTSCKYCLLLYFHHLCSCDFRQGTQTVLSTATWQCFNTSPCQPHHDRSDWSQLHVLTDLREHSRERGIFKDSWFLLCTEGHGMSFYIGGCESCGGQWYCIWFSRRRSHLWPIYEQCWRCFRWRCLVFQSPSKCKVLSRQTSYGDWRIQSTFHSVSIFVIFWLW